MKFNLIALGAEWKRANSSMRYYLASHVAANALMAALSIASMVLGAMGRGSTQLMLLGVAVLCGVQALVSWNVLERRYKIRYSLW